MVNVEKINSDIEDENYTNKSSSPNVITVKEVYSLLCRVHLFATFSEGDKNLQCLVEDIVIVVEDIICSKKQITVIQNPIPKFRQSSIISVKPGYLSEKLKILTSSNYHKV